MLTIPVSLDDDGATATADVGADEEADDDDDDGWEELKEEKEVRVRWVVTACPSGCMTAAECSEVCPMVVLIREAAALMPVLIAAAVVVVVEALLLLMITSGDTKSTKGVEAPLEAAVAGGQRIGSGLSKLITGWAAARWLVDTVVVVVVIPLVEVQSINGGDAASTLPLTDDAAPFFRLPPPPLGAIGALPTVGCDRLTGPSFSSWLFSFPSCGKVAARFLFFPAVVCEVLDTTELWLSETISSSSPPTVVLMVIVVLVVLSWLSAIISILP